MELTTAFVVAAIPAPGAPAREREAIGQACSALLETLTALGHRHLKNTPPHVAVDDIVQIVLLRFVQSGPRESESGPSSEAEVLLYLTACLRNELRDQTRKAETRKRGGKGWEQRQALLPNEEDVMLADEAATDHRARLVEIESALLEVIVPRTSATFSRSGARADFAQQFEEVRALAAGQLDMAELVAREAGAAVSKEEFERVRARIYRRHTRVRERLLSTIDELRAAGGLLPTVADDVVRYVSCHLNRQTGA